MADFARMTKQELIKSRRRYLIVAAAPCLVAIVLIAATALVMARWEDAHRDWPHGLWPVANVLAFVVIIAVILFVALFERWVAARCGFRCPHCRKALVGKLRRVLASGRCVYCGERMLDDVA